MPADRTTPGCIILDLIGRAFGCPRPRDTVIVTVRIVGPYDLDPVTSRMEVSPMADATEIRSRQFAVITVDARDDRGNEVSFDGPLEWSCDAPGWTLEVDADAYRATVTTPEIAETAAVLVKAVGDRRQGAASEPLEVLASFLALPRDVATATASVGDVRDVPQAEPETPAT